MVYTLIDHKMTSKNVQNLSGTQAAGEWFHCQVLDILWRHFMVYKRKTIENCRRFVFYNNMEKVRAELANFFVEKARALHLTAFLLSVLL